MENEYLTVEEVARFFKVSKTTVYRWTEEGKLKKYKAGRYNRYKRSEVEQVMESGQEG
jgi:excisionase family DNA binding protein